jgi:hypothetical protein
MEAPERIYVEITHPISDEYTEIIAFEDGDGIEYIRTDAFIKKACDAYCEVCGHYHHTVPYEICRHDCNYYDDFKKHLRGE